MTTIKDGVEFQCPHCGGERLRVTMNCWVDANNTDDVDVDWESSVSDMDKWFCDDCEDTLRDFPVEIRGPLSLCCSSKIDEHGGCNQCGEPATAAAIELAEG